jgi:cephalosporin-C deacetylase
MKRKCFQASGFVCFTILMFLIHSSGWAKMPELPDVLGLDFSLGGSNGITGSTLPVTLKITHHNSQTVDLGLDCMLKSDRVNDDEIIQKRTTNIRLNADSNAEKTIEFNNLAPGFYRVLALLKDGDKTLLQKSMIRGVDPEKIQTQLTRKKDFDDFWRKRKQELADIDPCFKIIKDDRSTGDVNVYLVEMQSYGNILIRGWYTVPNKPGPHPAILSVPGYNGDMQPYTQRKNVATLALNPRGHGNSKDDIDPKGKEFMFLGFSPGSPESYIYTGVYMDCVRAVDFLVSRLEIDPSRIGVEGGSQGGGLSFATAALDSRICFCAPDIPWLGDWTGYLAAAPWPNEHYQELIDEHPGLTNNDINSFLSYFDTMNMADWIACPVLMSVGLQDSVCPPRTAFATYNRVKTEKTYYVYPFTDHSVEPEHQMLKNEWMATILRGEKKGL